MNYLTTVSYYFSDFVGFDFLSLIINGADLFSTGYIGNVSVNVYANLYDYNTGDNWNYFGEYSFFMNYAQWNPSGYVTTTTDPISTDPISTDPTSTDPTSTDPTSTDPTSDHPGDPSNHTSETSTTGVSNSTTVISSETTTSNVTEPAAPTVDLPVPFPSIYFSLIALITTIVVIKKKRI